MFRGEMVHSISVVIPAHNAATTLGRAIESVLMQTRHVQEIIVVDDGSTDGTADIARRYSGVKVLSTPLRSGASVARNTGIRAAQSDWVAFLDADDEWLTDKIRLQTVAIGHDANQSMIFCASEEFASDGRSLGDTFRDHSVNSSENAWKALLKQNFVATPTVMAPRSLLLHLGGFDERLPVGEDQDLWIRLALSGTLAYVPERLVRVHVRPQSLSAFRPLDQSQHVLPMIEGHVRRLRHRLTSEEVRGILGERLRNAGRIALVHGRFVQGMLFFLRSVLTGYRPIAGLVEAVKATIAALFQPVLRSALGRSFRGMHRA